MNIDEALAVIIEAITRDPAMLDMVRHRLKSQAPALVEAIRKPEAKPVRPFPPIETITAAQCSVWDNWQASGGKRPRKGSAGYYADRFKVSVEVWTIPTDGVELSRHNSAFYGVAHLLDAGTVMKRAGQGKLRFPNSMDAEFKSDLVSMANNSMADARLGVFYGRDGSHIQYLDHTFAITKESDLTTGTVSKLIVSSPAGPFVFDGFRATDAKGNPLAQNCIASALKARSPKLAAGWRGSVI